MQRKLWQQKSDEVLRIVQEADPPVQVIEVPDKSPFQEAVQSVWKQFEGTRVGELAKRIQDTPDTGGEPALKSKTRTLRLAHHHDSEHPTARAIESKMLRTLLPMPPFPPPTAHIIDDGCRSLSTCLSRMRITPFAFQ